VSDFFTALLWAVSLVGMAIAPAIVPFVRFPWLAFLPAAVLALLSWQRRKDRSLPRRKRAGAWLLVGALAWVGFALYELRMQAWSRTVVAPIRVDLLLVGPLVVGLTIPGIVAMLRERQQPKPASSGERG